MWRLIRDVLVELELVAPKRPTLKDASVMDHPDGELPVGSVPSTIGMWSLRGNMLCVGTELVEVVHV